MMPRKKSFTNRSHFRRIVRNVNDLAPKLVLDVQLVAKNDEEDKWQGGKGAEGREYTGQM